MVVERPLTPPEIAVLEQAAAGLTAKQTADRLGRSVGTVKTHLRRAYLALGVHNKVDAVTAFQRFGMPGNVVQREAALTAAAVAAHRAGRREGWEAAAVALSNIHVRDWQRALNGADPYGTRAGRILAAHLRRSYTEEGRTS